MGVSVVLEGVCEQGRGCGGVGGAGRVCVGCMALRGVYEQGRSCGCPWGHGVSGSEWVQ